MPYLGGFYHLVWSTKNREASIDTEREQLLARSLRSTCDENGWTLYAFGIMPDHVHLAVRFSARFSISQVVRILKVNASHLLGNLTDGHNRIEFQWQSEYGAFLFHNERFEDVVRYVLNQQIHHAEQTLWMELEYTERLRP